MPFGVTLIMCINPDDDLHMTSKLVCRNINDIKQCVLCDWVKEVEMC